MELYVSSSQKWAKKITKISSGCLMCGKDVQIYQTLVQACKKQIFCHQAKYGKESGNSQRNQELTEMEKKEYKLLAEQQKILLSIEQSNNEKQNAVLQSFKNATMTSKPPSLMTSTEPLSELKSIENSQNVFIEKNPGSKHKRKQSDMSKKSSKQTPDGIKERGSEYLLEIMELMWNLDEKMRVNVPDRSVGMDNNEWMLKGIKGWVRRKLEIIEQLYVSVARLCKVAKGEFAGHEWVGAKELGNKGKKGQEVQKQSQGNMQKEQIMKSPKSYYQHQQSYNKSFKSQTLKNLQKNLNEIQKSHINVNLSPNSHGVWNTNNEGTIGSFNGMFSELEKYIKEISHIKGASERNKELAKQLITLSKEINQEKQIFVIEKENKQRVEKEKMSLEKQLISLKIQYETQVITVKRENEQVKKENELVKKDNELVKKDNELVKKDNELVKKDNELVKKDNELVKKRNQKLDQDNTKLLNEIHKMKTQIHQLTSGKQKIQKQFENMKKQSEKVQRQLEKSNRQVKQGQKYEKYYRESLSLEKELKILSQQNQKLLNQLKHTKQQYDQLVANTTKKEEQIAQQNNKASQQPTTNLNSKQILSSQQDTTTNKRQVQSISIMNSHQKSIKQSTNTSLMYKQQEKNMKKLNDQNKKLEESNRQLQEEVKQLSEENLNLNDANRKLTDSNMSLTERNTSLSQENHAISQLNHKLNHQSHKVNEQNRKYKQESHKFKEDKQEKQREIILLEQYNAQLCEESKRVKQQNTRVHEENKRIEQEFEYVLKEKLQLQSVLGQKTKQIAKTMSEKKSSRIQLKQKVMEVHERVQQLMCAREQVRRQIQNSKESVREIFECINEEITSAFAIFVNQFSTQLAAKHSQQTSTQTQMTTQTHELSIKEQQTPQTAYQNQSQSQLQQPKEQPQVPSSLTSQQYQEQIMAMTQQYQTMTEQYQALVQELNHCLYQLNTYKSMLDQVQIQKQLQKKYLEQDITQLKHKLTSNKHELTHSGQHPHNNLNTNKQSKLEINCESFSIIIQPQNLSKESYTQSFTHVQSQQQPQLVYCQDQLVTLESWLQQVKFDSQTLAQPFTSFCSFTFNSSHAQTYKSFYPSTLKQLNDLKLQNQSLKLQLERLKQENFLQKQSSVSQYRSPLKEIFSPSQKSSTHFQNTHEVEQNHNQMKMNMMGSLYNNFSLPKLVSKISHQQQSTHMKPNYDPLNPFEAKHSQQQPQKNQYPPLQMLTQNQTQKKPKKPITQKDNQLSDNTSSGLSIKALSHLQDEDESFDLCII